MAAPSISFLRALVRYGNASAANLANLESWQTAAIEEIASNKGGHIVSGSTNGSSFTQLASMTNTEWFSVLSDALRHIENGSMPQTRTIARLY